MTQTLSSKHEMKYVPRGFSYFKIHNRRNRELSNQNIESGHVIEIYFKSDHIHCCGFIISCYCKTSSGLADFNFFFSVHILCVCVGFLPVL